MRDQARYVKLGLFIVVGAGIAGGGAALLGGGSFLRAGLPFDTYVAESVQGLNVGTQVKLLGVTVGRVVEIGFAPAGPSGEQRVRVRGRLDLGDLPPAWRKRPAETLRARVRDGLRARLASVGLSGQLYLELDEIAGAPPPEEAPQGSALLIPSIPSLGERLIGSAERLAPALERLLDALVPAVRDVGAAAAALPAVLARMEELLGELSRLSAGQGAELGRSIENIRALTEDLRRLAARAERDPGGVLFGSPPPPVEPGRAR